jgi:hypothetical protein
MNSSPKLSILKNIDPRQLYRFFIDGQLYKKENGWVRYEQRQPGCIEGMSLAYCHMIDNFELSNGITLEYLAKLHDLIFLKIDKKLRKNRYPGQIREFRISFLVRERATSELGLKELMAERSLTDAFKKDITGCKTATDLYLAIKQGKKIRYIVETGYLPRLLDKASKDKAPEYRYRQARKQVKENITHKTLIIINHFNQTIDTLNQEEKLVFIIDCIKELERLHPFVDGNTRVFITILLNHLLMLHGFYPVIFEEPSIFDAKTTDEIIEEVKYGQELVKQIISSPSVKIFGHSIDDEDEENQQNICTLMSAVIDKIKLI